MHWALPAVAVAAGASFGAFFAMRVDKRRAARGARRIRERSLAAWSLLGGWPGLIAGGIAFRHKTRATRFKLKAVAAGLAHAAALLLLWSLMDST